MSCLIFETERLRCRRWRGDDSGPLLAVYGDADAMRWVGDGQPLSPEECARWLEVTAANYERRGYGMFALELRESGRVVGFCGLVHPDGQVEPEVKYALMRSSWGQGFATEAVRALLSYGWTEHGLSRVIATVAATNPGSQRVLEKAGLARVRTRVNPDASTTFVYEWVPSR